MLYTEYLKVSHSPIFAQCLLYVHVDTFVLFTSIFIELSNRRVSCLSLWRNFLLISHTIIFFILLFYVDPGGHEPASITTPALPLSQYNYRSTYQTSCHSLCACWAASCEKHLQIFLPLCLVFLPLPKIYWICRVAHGNPRKFT